MSGAAGSPGRPGAKGWPFRSAGEPPFIVAHRGGAGEAPENTLEAFAAAVAAGVAAIELDVAALAGGGLVVTHDEALAARGLAALHAVAPAAPTLDEALSWFAGEAPGIVAHVDVKPLGCEAEVVAALRRHDLLGRALVSSTHSASLRRFAQLEPALARAVGYPYDRHGVSGHPALAPVVTVALTGMRLALPLRVGGLVGGAAAAVAALERRVVSAAAVRRCQLLGVAVHVWTVDDPTDAVRLAALGVDAIVSDRPRLLAATLAP